MHRTLCTVCSPECRLSAAADSNCAPHSLHANVSSGGNNVLHIFMCRCRLCRVRYFRLHPVHLRCDEPLLYTKGKVALACATALRAPYSCDAASIPATQRTCRTQCTRTRAFGAGRASGCVAAPPFWTQTRRDSVDICTVCSEIPTKEVGITADAQVQRGPYIRLGFGHH